MCAAGDWNLYLISHLNSSHLISAQLITSTIYQLVENAIMKPHNLILNQIEVLLKWFKRIYSHDKHTSGINLSVYMLHSNFHLFQTKTQLVQFHILHNIRYIHQMKHAFQFVSCSVDFHVTMNCNCAATKYRTLWSTKSM